MLGMATGFHDALLILHRTFANRPLVTRAHILGRFLSCPFLPVVRWIPVGSRVLDIGGGHGVLARLAVAQGAAHVVVVEPDLRKSLPSFKHQSVRFVAGFDQAVAGSFDVVAIADVLYKVPLAEWDALFERVYARLVPGGLFLLKEIDPENRIKGLLNRQQERLASGLKLTLGDAFSYETRAQVGARLTPVGFVEFTATPLGLLYPHAHVLYTARRPITKNAC
jgi:SAM-dependent methyltransferase